MIHIYLSVTSQKLCLAKYGILLLDKYTKMRDKQLPNYALATLYRQEWNQTSPIHPSMS